MGGDNIHRDTSVSRSRLRWRIEAEGRHHVCNLSLMTVTGNIN